ncbi:hypothetical protein V2594_05345, partial [Tenacibaculum maritimum]|uniref:hypothetical protein n=1 Tax=Tenacibaculum maritimum TaxID=107401 RepID=UPI00387665DC
MIALKPLFGEDLSGFIGMLIGTYIIAPIALFSTYKFIFIWTRGKLTNNIIVVSIIILIFFNFLIYNPDTASICDRATSTIVVSNPIDAVDDDFTGSPVT